jgi:hypothetical protein
VKTKKKYKQRIRKKGKDLERVDKGSRGRNEAQIGEKKCVYCGIVSRVERGGRGGREVECDFEPCS